MQVRLPAEQHSSKIHIFAVLVNGRSGVRYPICRSHLTRQNYQATEGKTVSEPLRDKIVLITGASSGIGAATARAFAGYGAKLLLCARRLDKLQATEAELRDLGAPDVFCFELDVQDRDEVEGTLNTLPDAWQAIEILVNNAGLSRGLTRLWEDDVQNWEEMIDTNVKGLLYVTRTVVPGMVGRGRGHVINLGSIAGHMTYPGGHVYCATNQQNERSRMVCASI